VTERWSRDVNKTTTTKAKAKVMHDLLGQGHNHKGQGKECQKMPQQSHLIKAKKGKGMVLNIAPLNDAQ